MKDTLLHEGALKLPGFLDQNSVLEINKELDQLFSDNLYGAIVIDHSVKRLISPTRLNSINVLELALDVFSAIFDGSKDYVINGISVFQEQNNPLKLPWHSDSRKGEVKALLYITGGQEYSGGFQYINGSHLVEHNGKHHIDQEFISKNIEKVSDFSGLPGDLVIFDAYGVHSKKQCTDIRRTLFFNFLPRHYVNTETVDLNSGCFTPKVFNNLDLFVPNQVETTNFSRNFPSDFGKLKPHFMALIVFNTKHLIWMIYTKVKQLGVK